MRPSSPKHAHAKRWCEGRRSLLHAEAYELAVLRKNTSAVPRRRGNSIAFSYAGCRTMVLIALDDQERLDWLVADCLRAKARQGAITVLQATSSGLRDVGRTKHCIAAQPVRSTEAEPRCSRLPQPVPGLPRSSRSATTADGRTRAYANVSYRACRRKRQVSSKAIGSGTARKST